MHATPVALDLAKSVFQWAVADSPWRLIDSHRLIRARFEHWIANPKVSLVIMETCGSARHSARRPDSPGSAVRLPPAADVRACVRRDK